MQTGKYDLPQSKVYPETMHVGQARPDALPLGAPLDDNNPENEQPRKFPADRYHQYSLYEGLHAGKLLPNVHKFFD